MTQVVHTDTADRRDYEGFCHSIRIHTGIDLMAYKRTQMERRIRSMAERFGIDDLREYWSRLARDEAALRQFLDRVTINVSECFRNPEKFEELRRYVLPELMAANQTLSIWSAGCSYGAEIYSLKILLLEMAPQLHHRLLATDIDTGILARARQGHFSEDDLRNVAEPLRKKYFTHVGTEYQISDRLREGVEFQRHDLLNDRYPANMHLILCRNVVIYFSDDAKQRVFNGFYQTLRPGGYLLLGSTERIADAPLIGYTSPRPFFYHRKR